MVLPCGLARSTRPVILLLFALLLIPQGAPAHSPSGMQLNFHEEDRVLSVTITHTVANPLTHYIKRVLVTAGGSVIIDAAYTSQPAPQTFTYTYPLPQGIAGEVQVKAECSITGSITSTLQVREAPLTWTTVPEPSIPVPVRTPVEQVASGASQPTATTVAEAFPPAPAGAGLGLFPLAAAITLVLWWLRR